MSGRSERREEESGRGAVYATNARTRVELVHREGRQEHWIRFGRVVEEEILDRRRRVFWFQPGEVIPEAR